MFHIIAISTLMAIGTRADIYMHVPAGSNNRNRERTANRQNANRLFDSQNNDAGGYPWQGDREANGAPDPMVYYEGSILQLQWTAQHGCGADKTTDCEVNIQYACEDTMPGLRDGYPTGNLRNAGDNGFNLRQFQNNKGNNQAPGGDGTTRISKNTANNVEYGMHESLASYEACQNRQRNKGLYTADQNLNGNGADKTRQNPNGNRYGFECPEERDYYPYWAPTQWRDAAILVSRQEQCGYYQQESRNVKAVGSCTMTNAQRQQAPNGKTPISKAACEAAQGTWTMAAAWDTAAPHCAMHAYSRQNHLGDVMEVGEKFPRAAHYDWKIPGDVLDATGKDSALCVVRMRYNVSTTDYLGLAKMALEGELADATPLSSADNCEQGKGAGCEDGPNDLADGARPRYNRPYVQALKAGDPELGIALNTNQASRVFQDRSYVFRIQRRPADVPASTPIYNVNTRGKRGNIVQVYPSVEYDFVPQNMVVAPGSLLHVQWTGSDFNVNRGPNDGEGWRYSDRSNFVEAAAAGHNFPLPEDQQSFFDDYATKKKFALLGQQQRTNCGTFEDGTNNEQNSAQNCGKLNAAPAHFDGGLIAVQTKHDKKQFNFVSTRNNNFSNRAQKWTLMVDSGNAGDGNGSTPGSPVPAPTPGGGVTGGGNGGSGNTVEDSSEGGTNGGLVAGLVITLILLVVVIALAVWLYRRRSEDSGASAAKKQGKNKKRKKDAVDIEAGMYEVPLTPKATGGQQA